MIFCVYLTKGSTNKSKILLDHSMFETGSIFGA